jgi:hypothetical protein
LKKIKATRTSEFKKGYFMFQYEKRIEIRNLSNDALMSGTVELIQQERKITAALIEYLAELERRKLYLGLGFSSLHDYLVRKHGFSEGAAGRRVRAAKLLMDLPEVSEALAQGRVSLSNVSAVQGFIQQEQQKHHQPLPTESKREILEQVQGLSRRECDQRLFELSPESSPLLQDRQRLVGDELTQISFVASADLMEKLEKLRALLSNSLRPGSGYAELFDRLAEIALFKLDPALKEARAQARRERAQAKEKSDKNKGQQNQGQEQEQVQNENGTSKEKGSADVDQSSQHSNTHCAPPAEQTNAPTLMPKSASTSTPPKPLFIKRQPLPQALKRGVYLKSGGQCSFVDLKSGVRCNSRVYLQSDHVTPVCQGGETTSGNLRTLCRAHNQWEAIQKLGSARMKPYLPRWSSGQY